MRVVATRTTWTFSIQQKNNDNNKKKRAGRRRRSRWAPFFFFPLFFHILSWCICLPFLCFAHSQVERKDDRSGRRRFLSLFFQRVRMSRPRTGGKKERKKQKKLFNTSERSRRYITTLPSSASFFFSSSFALQLICIGFVFDSDLLDGLMSFNVERFVLFFLLPKNEGARRAGLSPTKHLPINKITPSQKWK